MRVIWSICPVFLTLVIHLIKALELYISRAYSYTHPNSKHTHTQDGGKQERNPLLSLVQNSFLGFFFFNIFTILLPGNLQEGWARGGLNNSTLCGSLYWFQWWLKWDEACKPHCACMRKSAMKSMDVICRKAGGAWELLLIVVIAVACWHR